MTWLHRLIQALWNFLEGATGENAYARYRRHARGAEEAILNPRAFYARQIEEKYRGVSRCC